MEGRTDGQESEEQARAAKEATGRAMFEKGDWGEDDSENDDNEDEDDDAWNMEKLRQETEALREKKEAERIAKLGGGEAVANGNNDEPDTNCDDDGIDGSDGDGDEGGAEDGAEDEEAS